MPECSKRVWKDTSKALFNEFKIKYPQLSYHPAKSQARKAKKAAKLLPGSPRCFAAYEILRSTSQ
jgi:predicted adenine nucleotide alpha hydrolase (AANH) superfamily ATPase